MNRPFVDELIPEVDLPAEFCADFGSEPLRAEAPVRGVGRRDFLKLTGLAGGGLLLAFSLGGVHRARAAEAGATAFAPNAFLIVRPDGEVVIYAKNPEIGQGVKTALPMIVAEELEVPWAAVRVEQSAISRKDFGRQSAGGSRSVVSSWDQLRKAGAVARTMLVAAAAGKWGVEASTCRADQGTVRHEASGRALSYGELATAAAAQPVPDPDSVTLKDRSEYTLLGKRITGVDNRAIVTGQPLFGLDQDLPGMRHAVHVKAPQRGASVRSADLAAIKRRPGIVDAFILEGNGRTDQLVPGVAIVGDSTWAVFQAEKALAVQWNDDGIRDSWTRIASTALELARGAGEVEAANGDFAVARAEAETVVEATYVYPFLSHATLEPQNCTAWFHDGRMEIWAPTQSPQGIAGMVAGITGVDEAAVEVHQLRIGGGFGRRLLNDYVAEVAAIAHRVDFPVKLTWSRESDMVNDFYRVGGFHALQGALDAAGHLRGLRDHFVSFTEQSPAESAAAAGGDPVPVPGGRPVRGGGMGGDVFPFPMVPHSRQERTLLPLGLPCGWWRAPGSCALAWVVQSFLHELSVAAGRDHREFLLELLGERRWLDEGNLGALHTGRAIDVIERATAAGDWGKPLPAGRGRGLAFYFCHLGHFAEVAEVTVDAERNLTVDRVVVAGDVGLIVNRSGAENQVEGSIVDGLSAMANQAITFEEGRVEQQNFDTFPLLRMSAQPKIEVHLLESDFAPTGLGEPALPPLAPAVCNAIWDALGHRVRTLPLSKEGFTL